LTNNLLSVREAQAHILSVFKPVSKEQVPVMEVTGRILGESILAPGDLPAFDNSSMDGFALRAQDIAGCGPKTPVTLRVVGDIPAGTFPDFSIQAGQAARIMTGAPIPPGADAVVPIEDTDAMNDDTQAGSPGQNVAAPTQVSIFSPVQPGQYVRPRGQDVRQGQQLLKPGRLLFPQDTGVLASIGRADVSIYRRPRVALFSSGDELAQPGEPLKPGQIYDTNQYVLAGLLESAGAQVFRLGVARDDPQEVYDGLRRSLDYQVDLIVTSAGVSVGAFDYIRHVIEAHGRLSFWRVNMRPGKPLAFGSFEGIPLIGLPGNPVSSYVGCRVFVLPVLQRLSGREQASVPRYRAVLAHPVESDGRESYLRAMVKEEQGRLVAALTGHQGSGNLLSLVQANALLIVPSGVKSLPSGSEVDIWLMDGSGFISQTPG
jgi:molybdopterin molybdotransferase